MILWKPNTDQEVLHQISSLETFISSLRNKKDISPTLPLLAICTSGRKKQAGCFGHFDSLIFLLSLVFLVLLVLFSLWSRCFAVRLLFDLSSLRPRRRLIRGREGGQGSGREHLEDASFIQSYPLLRINPTKGQPNQWLPEGKSRTEYQQF